MAMQEIERLMRALPLYSPIVVPRVYWNTPEGLCLSYNRTKRLDILSERVWKGLCVTF